jgi:GTP-binding protein
MASIWDFSVTEVFVFQNCEYIISAVEKKQYPNHEHYPEYVFLGRSNVGKSSFINALTNRKNLARTSSKPGKTQAINFYRIDDALYFVDVPGYGYASRSQEKRTHFGQYIDDYLKDNDNLKIAFLLIDTKVGPTADDILMIEYLKFLRLKIIVIGTKCDKIGTTLLPKQKKMIIEKLNIPESAVLFTSAETKAGIEQVRNLIENRS